MKKGIDVSHHQGNIVWSIVKSQIDFAIIRCGYGDNIKQQDDRKFETNFTECEKLGIPKGIYIYSYARNTTQAKSEAQHVLRLLNGRYIELPIFLDLEEPTNEKLHKSTLSNIYNTFEYLITKAGYRCGVYANKYWLESILPQEVASTDYIWLAQYSNQPTYRGEYGIWQYTSKGRIKGIISNVDLNNLYNENWIIPNTNCKPTAPTTPKEEIIYHTVVKGDNLTKIARKYGTSLKELARLNPQIKNLNLIYIGDKVRIK